MLTSFAVTAAHDLQVVSGPDLGEHNLYRDGDNTWGPFCSR